MATPRRQRITAIEAQRLIIDGLEDDSDLDDDSSESSAQECDVSYQNHADESSDDNFDDMPDGDVPTADISQPLSHSVSPDISPRTNDCWQDVGENDEEEEEEYQDAQPKKKKPRFTDFILDEAEVDDDVEDEEEWEDGAEEIIDKRRTMDETTARDIEGHRRLQMMLSKEEDEIEEYYRSKYADTKVSERRFGESEGELSDDITRQTLLPGVKDPNLWLVKCRIGEEKTVVIQLMKKFIAYQFTDDPLQIKSVIAPEGVKGYVYIESFKQTHVKQCIEGIGNLRLGQYQQMMVPIKEMTDVLKVVKEQTILKPRAWVRLKRGIFKDDIAQVDFVDTAQNQVHLKLLPRIDYTRNRGALRSTNDQDKKKKKRPTQKLFDIDRIRAIGGETGTDGDFLVFEGNRYNRKGFLFKNFAMSAIIAEGVKPTLSELEKFEERPEGKTIELAETRNAEDQGHNFAPGDNIEVSEGELMHLRGKVVTIDGNKITILPQHEDLVEPLEFPAHELKKFFRMGDHVKVLSGNYEGDTGLIVRVEDHMVVFISDLTMHELKVLSKDLQLCTDMATGVDSLGQFQWGDLVQLDPQTVGTIVRLERENFQVLNMHGKLVNVKHQAVTKKKDSRYAVALDSEHNNIQIRDVVKVIDGPHSGRQGEIRHLYRGFAFLHSKMMLENGGVFVCRTRHLVLAGGAKQQQSAGGIFGGFAPMSPRISSPMHPRGGGGRGFASPRGGGGAGGRGRGGRRDNELIGKTVRITQGPYKGHIGMVKDATETTARVELHSRIQTISVDRSRLTIVGAPGKSGMSAHSSRTPMYGSQTPMYGAGSRTPMYGSQTPVQDGSRTPHYGSQTPQHDGSRTPGQSGAWDPTSTPARFDCKENEINVHFTHSYVTFSRSSDFGDFHMDEPSPSPGYNPATPGYQPDTPQGQFTPQTPGAAGMWKDSTGPGSEISFSSFNPSPSPSASASAYTSTPSPAGGYVPTPSPAGYQGTPSPAPFGTPSPLGYSPMTPGTPTQYNPQTPGAGMESSSTEWQTTDIEVKVKSGDSDLKGQNGIIRGISGGMCSVFLPKEDRVMNIMSEHLEPVTPERGDKVKVVLGEERESTGDLLSIDNQEGVVKLDHGDIKMLQLRYLCKMKAN
ncbi:Transcription elongation factor SPT5 [Nymphon striatum]|nr:Transcription elongation factor SPT5 [Nymphon striatum]